MTKPIILLTRPIVQNKNITPEILNLGCTVISEPMLKIIPLKPIKINIDKQTGLIFTSVRAIENMIINNPENLLCPIYAIGNKTAEYLHYNGFNNIIQTTKNSKEMQNYLDSNKKAIPKELLHICGEHIVTEFTIKNTSVEKYIVYKAEKIKSFTENLLLQMQNINTILFYSARSAENFIKLIKQYSLEDKCASINILCISVRTAKYIKYVHWNNIYIVQKPDHPHMINMLRNVLETQR